jgi:hypothetical protein
MASYEIVIDKKDGKIEVDGMGFSGLDCLKFLEKLKLGDVVAEQFKTNEPFLVNSVQVAHTVLSEDDS